MRAIRGAGRGRVTLLAVLAAVVLASSAMFAAAVPNKPGITVQLSPASQTVQRGQSVTYAVTLTSTGGFSGTTTLAASKLPKGATAVFRPASVSLSANANAIIDLTLATTSTTPLGTATFDITATSGKTSGSVAAGVIVNAAPSGSISMTASPASVTMESGSTAVYSLQLTRSNLSGNVTFAVSSGVPAGATVAFSPNQTDLNTSTLQVAVPDETPDGTYTLDLTATATGGAPIASAAVRLVIDSSKRPFNISGDLETLLAPGVSAPLELTLENPINKQLAVTNLTVTLQVTPVSGGVCGPSDYRITQYSGPYPLALAKREAKSLGELGVPSAQWPQVAMLNRNANQDGCKGAHLSLSYIGSAQGD